VIPTIYETMSEKQQYNKMVVACFGFIVAFYLPVAVIGYWAYGNETQSPIYNNLCDSTDGAGSCSYQSQLGLYLAILGVTVHVILSYALNINPVERAVCTPHMCRTFEVLADVLWLWLLWLLLLGCCC
jgi:hypothetical protein